MKKIHVRSILLLTLSLVIFFGCASRPVIEKMVPEDSAVYLQIDDPESFLQNLDDYITPFGLKSRIGGMSIREFMEMALSAGDSPFTLDKIEMSFPIGFVAVPGDEPEKMDFMIFFPVKEGLVPADVAEEMNSLENITITVYENYLIFFSNPDSLTSFPPKKRLDVSRFRDYPDDSIKTYFSFPIFLNAMGVNFDELSDILTESSEETTPFIKEVMDGYTDLIKQIEGYYLWMDLNSESMEAYGDMTFSGDMARLLKTMKPMTGIREYGTLLPDEGLYQGIYNIHPDNMTIIQQKIIESIYNSDSFESEEWRRYLNLLSEFSESMGPGGAFSFDMDLSPDFLSSPVESINFDFSTVMTLSDPGKFSRVMASLYEESFINSIMEESFKDTGYKLDINMIENREDSGFPYYEISYSVIQTGSKNQDPSTVESIVLLKKLFDKIKFYSTVRNDLYFGYMGSSGVNGLRTLVYTQLHLNTPEDVQESWVDSIPDSANFAWSFSMGGLSALILDAAGIGSEASPETGKDAMTGYITAGDELSGGMLLPTGGLLMLVQAATLLGQNETGSEQ